MSGFNNSQLLGTQWDGIFLLPCPCCEAKELRIVPCAVPEPDFDRYTDKARIVCEHCHMSSPDGLLDEIAAVWNTRPSSDETSKPELPQIKARHTPGPWRPDDYIGQWVFSPNDEFPIAQVRGWSYLTNHFSKDEAAEIQIANSRLIAKAPEMFELLKSVIANNTDMHTILNIMNLILDLYPKEIIRGPISLNKHLIKKRK